MLLVQIPLLVCLYYWLISQGWKGGVEHKHITVHKPLNCLEFCHSGDFYTNIKLYINIMCKAFHLDKEKCVFWYMQDMLLEMISNQVIRTSLSQRKIFVLPILVIFREIYWMLRTLDHNTNKILLSIHVSIYYKLRYIPLKVIFQKEVCKSFFFFERQTKMDIKKTCL